MGNQLTAAETSKADGRLLFWGCFVALVATAFAFSIRANVVGAWQQAFGLSETEKGEILGAGFWPFGISIVLFSLVIDKIGYGRSMIFAFLCHVASVIITVFATGYWTLYVGACLCGLAAGTVEAVVNPVVATMYPKNKTKMLTILHAGWAGGVALCGVLVLSALNQASWQVKVALLLVPTVLYALMMLRCKFPINERVAASVPYRDMLKECGMLGALIVAYMIMVQMGRVFKLDPKLTYGIMALTTVVFGVYTRSLGRLMYTFLLLVMILLAITELGTDGWMKELRDPAMREIGLDGGWILVYTAGIMMILRFCIGPIAKVLRPLGVLFVSSLMAAAGLYFLAGAAGVWLILITATIYGAGQAFFWPVTLGLVSERFPRGGALTLNAIAGVGMLGVGIIGLPLMGIIQDRAIDNSLKPNSALYAKVIAETEKRSVFGNYKALDGASVSTLNAKVELYDLREKNGHQPEVLAKSEAYSKLVTRVYDELIRQKDDKAEKSHEEMLAALTAKGLLIGPEEYKTEAEDARLLAFSTQEAKKQSMATIAILPLIMALCYVGLIVYFKAKGGYTVVDISDEGKVIGEHKPTPKEVVTDDEVTPSE